MLMRLKRYDWPFRVLETLKRYHCVCDLVL